MKKLHIKISKVWNVYIYSVFMYKLCIIQCTKHITSHLLYMMSHDINSIISMITSYLRGYYT